MLCSRAVRPGRSERHLSATGEVVKSPRMKPLPPLSDELFAKGFEFDFFQALKLLDAIREEQPADSVDPIDRLAGAIRIRALPSLAFPASSIHRIGRPVLPEDRRGVAVVATGRPARRGSTRTA